MTDEPTPGKLSARDRQVAVLLAAGFTQEETGRKLSIPVRTISRIATRPEVKAHVELLDERGLTPWDKLEALLYSRNESTALRASVALAKLGPRPLDAVAVHTGPMMMSITIVHHQNGVDLTLLPEDLERMGFDENGGRLPGDEAKRERERRLVFDPPSAAHIDVRYPHARLEADGKLPENVEKLPT